MSSQEERIRTPIRGIRQRLRLAVKASGFDGKFSTDLLRDGRLKIVIKSDVRPVLFNEFEGRQVVIQLSV